MKVLEHNIINGIIGGVDMIKREEYLNKLISFKDEQVIKVVTGIRRCGKSTLLEMYRDYLLENGVGKEQIIEINFENMAFEDITEPRVLYDYILPKLLDNRKNYIFLDEVQKVKDFQKAVDSLYIKKNVDRKSVCRERV